MSSPFSLKPTGTEPWTIVPVPPATSKRPITLKRPAPLEPFWDTLYFATARGFWGGLSIGTIVGTIVPILGNIVGAVVGLVLGTLLGLFNGVVLGTLNKQCFVPLTDVRHYRWATYLIGVTTTVIVTVPVYELIASPFRDGVGFFGSFVLTCIFAYSFYACHRVADWYISVNLPKEGAL